MPGAMQERAEVPPPSEGLDVKRDDAACGPCPERWWALLVYFLLGLLQGAAWATFSAVPARVTKDFFQGQEVSEFTINLMLNIGLILYVPSVPPAMWLQGQRERGVMVALRVGAVMTAAGTALRCHQGVWHAMAGQVLIAVAGPMVWGSCASFSSTWFPPEERTFTTAVGGGAGYLGPAFQFLFALPVTSAHGFRRLLLAEAALSAAVCALIFAALPARPRRPPSLSAASHLSKKATGSSSVWKFVDDLSMASRSADFWLVCLSGGIVAGLFGAYSASFPIILADDEGAGCSMWLGFVSLGAFVLGSWAVGWASELLFARRLRRLLALCNLLALLGALVFALAVPSPVASEGLLEWRWLHFAAVALMSAAVGGVFPVSIELASEQVFPAEEATVAGACQGINCLAGMLYLFGMDRVPNAYVNLPVLVGMLIGLVLLSCSNEQYHRRDVDEGAACELVELNPSP